MPDCFKVRGTWGWQAQNSYKYSVCCMYGALCSVYFQAHDPKPSHPVKICTQFLHHHSYHYHCV